MPDVRETKDALARLARGERAVVERAERAVRDVDAAAAFREDGGLTRLRDAVVATDDPERARRGRAALLAFEAFAAAAHGDYHFRRGRGTVLSETDEGGDDDAGDPHR